MCDVVGKFLQWCNQVLLIILYITIISSFWIFLIQNQNWLILKLLVKKIKRLVKWVEKFKSESILALKYKERNDHKMVHSSANLIASDSDIDETFKPMHQSIMTKVKNSAGKYWS